MCACGFFFFLVGGGGVSSICGGGCWVGVSHFVMTEFNEYCIIARERKKKNIAFSGRSYLSATHPPFEEANHTVGVQ